MNKIFVLPLVVILSGCSSSSPSFDNDEVEVLLKDIIDVEKDSLKNVEAVSWAAPEGESLKEVIMRQKDNREY